MLKKQIDTEYEINNKVKSNAIKKLSADQLVQRFDRENSHKNHLDDKFKNRLNKKHENQLKLVTDIENLEIVEKALIEEYNSTISRKDVKDKKIKEINDQFRSGGLFIYEEDEENLDEQIKC